MFGKDFWKWLEFILHVIKILTEIFKDDDDPEKSKEHLVELHQAVKKFKNVPNKT